MDDVPLRLGHQGGGQETVLAVEVSRDGFEWAMPHALVRDGELDAAGRLLPEERPYPAGQELLGQLIGQKNRLG